MCSYVGIFISNKRQRQTIHQHGGHMLTALRREKRLANTVGLILIVLCCTFIPALSIPLILAILGFSTADLLPFRPFYALFITLNGLLNPLLNYGRNKDVRRAVRLLITCPAQHLGGVNTASFTVQSEAKWSSWKPLRSGWCKNGVENPIWRRNVLHVLVRVRTHESDSRFIVRLLGRIL